MVKMPEKDIAPERGPATTVGGDNLSTGLLKKIETARTCGAAPVEEPFMLLPCVGAVAFSINSAVVESRSVE